jgi:predicted TIM-barrel fold metal-dependent hydrolase
METSESYVGFPPLPDKNDIVNTLLNDPPYIHWRVVRKLFRIKQGKDREEIIEALRPRLYEVDDDKIKYRLNLALQALHRPIKLEGYRLVKQKGIFKSSEISDSELDVANRSELPTFFPVVDFHIHPVMPDIKLFKDMRDAGVTRGVIVATDTDPNDVDRPEINTGLKAAFAGSSQSSHISFESLLKHIRAHLYSPTQVTNQDVADWVSDYPDFLIGFGSVNLSKDREYVVKHLEEMERLNLKGVNLLPHAQFFDPSSNPNMDLLFEYCSRTGSIILSHTGCGTGPFEIPELSRTSHPSLWEPQLSKHQDVPVVLAHFGSYSREIPGVWLLEAMQLGKKYRNVYVDLAAVDWLLDRENVVQEIRKTIGFDRVLFATNYPHFLTPEIGGPSIVSGIKTNTHLTKKEKRKILGENAVRLLGLNWVE